MNQCGNFHKFTLNVTLGAYTVPVLTLFKNENGKIVPHIKSLKKFFDLEETHNQIKITLKLSKTPGFGTWTEKGYKNGIFEMLQNKEIDGCFIPVPMDTIDPPGQFSAVSGEEEFYIESTLKASAEQLTDLMCSFSVIKGTTWFLFLFAIFTLQIIVNIRFLEKYKGTKLNLSNLIWSSIKTIFRQDFPHDKSKIIWVTLQAFLLLLFGAAFNSEFSTKAVIGEVQERVETLEDLVRLQRTPVFLQGESRHELFAKAFNPTFQKVYELAKKMHTSEPLFLDPLMLMDSSRLGKVLLASNRIIRSRIPMINHFGINSDLVTYISPKPYHRSLMSFLSNPRLNSTLRKEFYRRHNCLALHLTAAGLSQWLMGNIPNEILDGLPFEINLKDMITHDTGAYKTLGIIKPLESANFLFLFLILIISFVCVSLVFTCLSITCWLNN